VGVLVEVNCETDFVAKEREFPRLRGRTSPCIIAAAHPLYVSRDDVPGALIEAEREIYKGQVKGKRKRWMSKVVDGKLEKFIARFVCWSRDSSRILIRRSGNW